MEKLEKEKKEWGSTCKGAVTTATTASNNVDRLKRQWLTWRSVLRNSRIGSEDVI